MILKTYGKSYLFLWVAAIFFCLALYFQVHSKKPEVVLTKQDSAFNLNQHFIKFFSIGNKRMVSDLIWIQTLLEADLERYEKRDLGNWLYLRFLTVSELDPRFYENYQFGGMFLSIMKDDLEGAADLYERGLKIYPDDYKLNYQAGFNYYFEMGEYKKGLEKLKKVEKNPKTNEMVRFIINKLTFETSHDFDLTINFLKINLQNATTDDIKEKLTADIYALSAERDLECLNQSKGNCHSVDPEGNKYIYSDGKWHTQRPFQLYRIYRREFQRKRETK